MLSSLLPPIYFRSCVLLNYFIILWAGKAKSEAKNSRDSRVEFISKDLVTRPTYIRSTYRYLRIIFFRNNIFILSEDVEFGVESKWAVIDKNGKPIEKWRSCIQFWPLCFKARFIQPHPLSWPSTFILGARVFSHRNQKWPIFVQIFRISFSADIEIT